MHRTICPHSFIALLLLTGVICAQPATRPGDRAAKPEPLDAQVRAEIARFKGKVTLFAKNLDTGQTYEINPDEPVRTASTIKLPIMAAVFALVAEGKVKWGDELTLTDKKKVQGTGVLAELSDGLRLTLRDAVTLMIVLSDNTATNLVLDHVTADAVNERLDGLGLKVTRSMRKISGGGESKAFSEPGNKRADGSTYGIGRSTPREMVTLLEKLERGEVVSPAASREMIGILKRQQYHEGIGRTLKDVEIASKPGSLDHLRSDVGIIYTKRGRIAMAITCEDIPEVDYTNDNPGNLLMSRLSLILIDGLGK
ncbi:MAG TPA: serine hydrolase [Blastocatellia bacterium]|nr:serine hydrolase [Blastocatellia bacterium]